MLVYVTPRFLTVNATCLRQEPCEREVRTALEKTAGIGKIMAYRPQGAMMVDYEGKRITPEQLTGVVTRAMAGEPVRWTPIEVRYTGSRKVPNKLVAQVSPGRVTLVSERFL
ncbi:MAG: hypothetical protein HYV08_06255 [Deltaproteobacteria bacterium]|nr:hypothetical protein [Deltaproteobacteria bacterium]MBI3078267.1 hypothetical protein [Deltaproteobacteria bacterium]